MNVAGECTITLNIAEGTLEEISQQTKLETL
jgi:hypothetical protein